MLAAIVGIKIVLGWTLSKEVNRHQEQGEGGLTRKRHLLLTTTTTATRLAEIQYNNGDSVSSRSEVTIIAGRMRHALIIISIIHDTYKRELIQVPILDKRA